MKSQLIFGSCWLARACSFAIAGLVLFGACAKADNIDFSFTNTVGNVSGTVTGEIFGLVNNSTSAATDLVILSGPSAVLSTLPSLDMFAYAADIGKAISSNSFTLVNDQITAASFQIFGGWFDLNVLNEYNELSSPPPNGTYYIENQAGLAGDTFSSPTPEPSSAILLVTALLAAGLALATRRA